MEEKNIGLADGRWPRGSQERNQDVIQTRTGDIWEWEKGIEESG